MVSISGLPPVPPSGGWWIHISFAGRQAVVDGDHYIVPPWRRARDAMLAGREPRQEDAEEVTRWLQAHPEYWCGP